MAIRYALLLAAMMTAACGPPSHLATADDVPQMAPSERREVLASSLAELSSNPRADDVRAELDRSKTWLAQAERLTAEDEEPERVTLLLDAVEAHLGAIKAHYARARAEESYATLRERVEENP